MSRQLFVWRTVERGCWLSRLESMRDILIGGKERDYEFAELKTKL
jgi:hypothetical protein